MILEILTLIELTGIKKMNREKAYNLLIENVKNKNLVKHCLAVEAIMRDTAEYLIKEKNNKSYDEDRWAIAGLMHDIDYDKTFDSPDKHSLVGAEILKEYGFDDEIIYAVKAHNYVHGLEPKSEMDIALLAADPLSGLIVAAALIKPEKKLKSIDTGFVLNRYKEKLFAKGANRQQMLECEKIGLSLEKFIEIGLASMQKIDKDLGL
jgi:putative nucleotidyltransferase with HDIG domain